MILTHHRRIFIKNPGVPKTCPNRNHDLAPPGVGSMERKVVFGSRCTENVLSNFCPGSLKYEGIEFQCPESMFQGLKALWSSEPQRVRDIAQMDCYEARKAGRRLRDLDISEWNKVSVTVMRIVIRERWKQHPEFRRRVTNYGKGKCYLYHFDRNPKKSFWGGENNMLGKLIMEYY